MKLKQKKPESSKSGPSVIDLAYTLSFC